MRLPLRSYRNTARTQRCGEEKQKALKPLTHQQKIVRKSKKLQNFQIQERISVDIFMDAIHAVFSAIRPQTSYIYKFIDRQAYYS